jgi:hypothetical protein
MFRAIACVVSLGFFGGFSSEEAQLRKILVKKLGSVASPSCQKDRDLLIDCLNFHKKFDGEDQNKEVNQQDKLPVTNDNQHRDGHIPSRFFSGRIKVFDLRGLGLSDLTEMELRLLLTAITSTKTLAIFNLRENGFNFNDTSSTLAMHMAEAGFTMVSKQPAGQYTSYNKWKKIKQTEAAT